MRAILSPRGLAAAAATILVISSTGGVTAQDNETHSQMGRTGGHRTSGQVMGVGMDDVQVGLDMHGMPQMGTMSSNVHEVHLAAHQRVLAHRATIYTLLVALNIDRQQNLDLLMEVRERFAQVQHGLSNGDVAHGLDGSDLSSVQVSLLEVDVYWGRYEAVIDRLIEQPALSAVEMSMLKTADADLQRSLGRMIETAERLSYGGRGHSILLPTVRHAQLLSAMLQDLAADYLMLASGHDTVGAYLAMREKAAEFDAVLHALLHGDGELRVLGAPTAEIREQYNRVQAHWLECWSAIRAMSASPNADPVEIAGLLGQVDQVAEQVDAAVALYHGL